jgi:hypothetical protein
MPVPSPEEIMAARSHGGGWTRSHLKAMGHRLATTKGMES